MLINLNLYFLRLGADTLERRYADDGECDRGKRTPDGARSRRLSDADHVDGGNTIVENCSRSLSDGNL